MGISGERFHEAEGIEDWRVAGEGACAFFATGSFVDGARLVQAIGEFEDLDPHHPDVDLRHDGVTVRLITYGPGYFRLSERDIELARRIPAVGRELGASADPSGLQTIQVAVDALVRTDVMPFWRAVFGYDDRADGDEDLIGSPLARADALVPADGRAAPATEPDPLRRLGAARPVRGSRRRGARETLRRLTVRFDGEEIAETDAAAVEAPVFIRLAPRPGELRA